MLNSPQNGDEWCTKALIAFGARINATNRYNQTPLDIAIQNQVRGIWKCRVLSCDSYTATVKPLDTSFELFLLEQWNLSNLTTMRMCLSW